MIVLYATAIVLLHIYSPSAALPIAIMPNRTFEIFYPFSKTVFLVGDYTSSFLLSNLVTISFYILFLWLLGGVFGAFRKSKIFTSKGVLRLSRFYIVNLLVPLLFLGLLVIFGEDMIDMLRISLLHLVIGVFAFFMAAIFKQGLVLQEEQDLIF
jgi:hypothetical protein